MNTITQFEKDFAAFFGHPKAFAFWKARVAFYAILKSLGITTGDEVIVPGYTCVMDINPIMYLGAKPVYVDIEPDTFNIDPALIEAKITPNTKIILAQHTYGYPCQLARIMDIARKHNLIVIEDCCLTLGAKYKGKLVGTFGKAAYFSFQWNKPFTTGLGGMALVNNDALAEKMRAVQQNEAIHPSAKEKFMLAAQLAVYRTFIYPRTTALAQSVFRTLTKKGAVLGSSGSAEFSPEMEPGFFKQMSAVQAHSGIRQLRKLKANIEHRKEIASLYDYLLTQKGWPTRNYDASIIDPVMVRYPVRIKEKDKALAQAAGAGIELGSWFECPLHPIETPMEKYYYTTGLCPQAEKASAEIVNLPCHPRVNERTARKTVDFITSFTPVI